MLLVSIDEGRRTKDERNTLAAIRHLSLVIRLRSSFCFPRPSLVVHLPSFVVYYTAKQKPPYQRSGKAACQPGTSRQAKLNQTYGPAVGAARIVPRTYALLAR
jgi:hypothetical protein